MVWLDILLYLKKSHWFKPVPWSSLAFVGIDMFERGVGLSVKKSKSEKSLEYDWILPRLFKSLPCEKIKNPGFKVIILHS